jgi:hypothetical protein
VDEESGNPGGITTGDIKEGDIRPLGSFMTGSEVYVESDDPEDCLDDTDEESQRKTHIWWLAEISLAPPALS